MASSRASDSGPATLMLSPPSLLPSSAPSSELLRGTGWLEGMSFELLCSDWNISSLLSLPSALVTKLPESLRTMWPSEFDFCTAPSMTAVIWLNHSRCSSTELQRKLSVLFSAGHLTIMVQICPAAAFPRSLYRRR
eukprot:scaffold14153_cov61-Phaeocystis_antarctica.AAC.6